VFIEYLISQSIVCALASLSFSIFFFFLESTNHCVAPSSFLSQGGREGVEGGGTAVPRPCRGITGPPVEGAAAGVEGCALGAFVVPEGAGPEAPTGRLPPGLKGAGLAGGPPAAAGAADGCVEGVGAGALGSTLGPVLG